MKLKDGLEFEDYTTREQRMDRGENIPSGWVAAIVMLLIGMGLLATWLGSVFGMASLG